MDRSIPVFESIQQYYQHRCHVQKHLHPSIERIIIPLLVRIENVRQSNPTMFHVYNRRRLIIWITRRENSSSTPQHDKTEATSMAPHFPENM